MDGMAPVGHDVLKKLQGIFYSLIKNKLLTKMKKMSFTSVARAFPMS